MGELKPDVDLQALNEWFADIPPGPYDALNTMGGWEVRQIDTDPTDKHNWPFRLCSSISGQTAECDAAVFNFIAGVINAWPQILDAARTEGRGDGEPVASDKALFDALWDLVAAIANEGIPKTPRTKAAFKVAHQAALDRLRKDWSSPIREPEISKPDRELAAREAFQVLHPHENWNDLDERYDARGGYHPMQIKAFEVADAILNLAPVGGRERSSQSQPVLSPKSDNQWLVWSGDDQPVEDGVLVDVRFNRRCGGYGKEANGYPADLWDWSHDGTADPVIIEWRISPPEISAADGASSRHSGQLRDEQNPSLNEESQTNGS